jgi:hypothetical protein
MIQRATPKSNKNGTPESSGSLEELHTLELKALSWHRVFDIPWSESTSGAYREEEMAWDIVRFGMLEAYLAGEMKFELLLKGCAKVLHTFNIAKAMQQRMLGEIAYQALRVVPRSFRTGALGRPKGRRGPAWLRRLAASMVDEAVCDRLARDHREGQAFDTVSKALHEMGLEGTPRQVESWYGEHRDAIESAKQTAFEELHVVSGPHMHRRISRKKK